MKKHAVYSITFNESEQHAIDFLRGHNIAVAKVIKAALAKEAASLEALLAKKEDDTK